MSKQKNRFFQLQPWVPELLPIVITDKLFDKNPWNFDTENVKQYATRGKKEEIIILSMRGTPLIQNKSVVIEDTVVLSMTEKKVTRKPV